jgi:hypothetical protein
VKNVREMRSSIGHMRPCSYAASMPTPQVFHFLGGDRGPWKVTHAVTVRGEPLPPTTHVDIVEGEAPPSAEAAWRLSGVTSNERYVERAERALLVATQPTLGRVSATCGAMIPIRKSGAWWDLTQDERRAILEERSAHIATGLEFLPAIARRLHHCRDLGGDFDFITWFEFAPSDAQAFEELLDRLRATEEWTYVEREIDMRVTRCGSDA